MQELLLAYFRALKSPRGAALLHVNLEGLAGVAPLLNSRVIGDLLEILQERLQAERLAAQPALQCVRAALGLAQTAGSMLSVDVSVFLQTLYGLRWELVEMGQWRCVPEFLECVDVC